MGLVWSISIGATPAASATLPELSCMWLPEAPGPGGEVLALPLPEAVPGTRPSSAGGALPRRQAQGELHKVAVKERQTELGGGVHGHGIGPGHQVGRQESV